MLVWGWWAVAAAAPVPWDTAAIETWKRLEIRGPDTEMSRREEDRALVDAVSVKLRGLIEVEADVAPHTGSHDLDLAIQAWWTLGEIYTNMAAAFLTSQQPSYLTAKQRNIYIMALEDKAHPFEVKAGESYRSSARRATDAGFWCHDAVSRLEARIWERSQLEVVEILQPPAGLHCRDGRDPVRRGWLAMRLQDWSLAIESFRSSADPDDRLALAAAQTYAGLTQDAENTYQGLLRTTKYRIPRVAHNAAMFFARHGDMKRAERTLTKAKRRRNHPDFGKWLDSIHQREADKRARRTRQERQLAMLTVALDPLKMAVAQCEDQSLIEEVMMIIEQGRILLEYGDADLVPDMLEIIEAYAPAAKACGFP